MESKNYSGINVLYDEIIYNKKELLREFLDEKNASGVKQLVDSIKDKFECIVVLGGDGTMLRCIQEYSHLGLPFLGINFGTKGFLLNDRQFINESSRFSKKVYPMLEGVVRVKGREEQSYSHKAFNDIQVKAASGRAVNIDVKIGNHSSANIIGDGILISTPAGSTGYNSSAHGPILPHSSPNFIATPILPFMPKHFSPVVYEDKDKVKITNNGERGRPISVYADGIPVVEGVGEEMEVIVRKSKQKVTLLIEKNYEKIWDAKIFMEQGFSIL